MIRALKAEGKKFEYKIFERAPVRIVLIVRYLWSQVKIVWTFISSWGVT